MADSRVRTLLATTAGAGHVLPVLGLAEACQSLGHDVLVVAPRGAEEALARSTVAYVLGEDPSPEDSQRVWVGFGSLDRDAASIVAECEWFATLCASALLPAMERAVATFDPAVVVREPCEYASGVVADRLGIRRLHVGISTAAGEMGVLSSLVRPDLDARAVGLSDRLIADPYLTRFPASLDPSAFPTTIRYRVDEPASGPATADIDGAWADLPRPVVYVTLGTAAMRQPIGRALLRVLVRALATLDVALLVSTAGASGLDDLGHEMSNVHVTAWIPQREALAVSSLVVCHGGSGTTYGALAAGVPLVLTPLFADQPTNARLVDGAGAGITVVSGASSAQANAQHLEGCAEEIRDAVRTVLGDPAFAAAARRIGDELRKLPSIGEAVELALERGS